MLHRCSCFVAQSLFRRHSIPPDAPDTRPIRASGIVVSSSIFVDKSQTGDRFMSSSQVRSGSCLMSSESQPYDHLIHLSYTRLPETLTKGLLFFKTQTLLFISTAADCDNWFLAEHEFHFQSLSMIMWMRGMRVTVNEAIDLSDMSVSPKVSR